MNLGGLALLLAMVIVAVALGGAAWRLFGPARSTFLERAYLTASFGAVALTWWGVVLAQTASFRPAVLLGPALVAAAAIYMLALRSPPDRRGASAGEDAGDLGPAAPASVLAITILAAFLYTPAFDVRLEARDPGVYALAGESLARQETLAWVDPGVTMLPQGAREYFFPDPGRKAGNESYRYMGFYLERIDSGRVVPQALPAYPVWAAAGYWVAGPTGALSAAAVLTWLAACGLAVLGVALYGRLGLMAGVLFAGGILPGWFARYSAAETMALWLLVVALLSLLRYRQHASRFHGLLSAVAFGLCVLTKAELFLVLAPLGLLLALDVAAGRCRARDLVFFWSPVAVLGLHGAVYARGWLWPYYYDVLRQLGYTPIEFVRLATVTTFAYLVVLVGLGRLSPSANLAVRRFLTADTRAGARARTVASVSVVALMAAGYWLRPWLHVNNLWQSGWNAANHLDLGMGVGVGTLALATIGLAAATRRPGRVGGASALLVVIVPLCALVLYERQIVAYLMWAYRRWVPLLIPAVYLYAIGGVEWAGRRAAGLVGPAVRPIIVAALVAGIAAEQLRTAPWFRAHQQLTGAAPILEEIRTAIGPRDAVIFEPRNRRGAIRLEAAVGVDLQRAVYRLPSLRIDTAALQSLIRAYAQRGDRTFLMTTGYLEGLPGIRATPAHELVWRSPVLEEVFSPDALVEGRVRLPRNVETLDIRARIYELESAEPAQLPQVVVDGERRGTLDLGLWDDTQIVGRFFHAPETSGVVNFRWTTNRAVFLLQGVPADAAEIVIRAQSNRLLEGQAVEAWLDGWPLGSRSVPANFGNMRMSVPARWRPPSNGLSRLEIRVPAVVPNSVDPALTDERLLGIPVDRVFWTRAEPSAER